MKIIKIPTHLSIHLEYNLIGWGGRLGGFALDWFVKWLYITLIITSITGSNSPDWLIVILYLPLVFYSLLMEWFNNGQSLGKMVIKGRVISMNGQQATIYQILTRWFFNMVDVWGVILLTIMQPELAFLVMLSPIIGGLIMIISPLNQRLGDIAAGTLVVSTSKNNITLDQTIFKYSNGKSDYEPKYPQIMKLSDKDITLIQQFMEKGDAMQNEELLWKLATHVKKILKIETSQTDYFFLKTLLTDYNYYAKEDAVGVFEGA